MNQRLKKTDNGFQLGQRFISKKQYRPMQRMAEIKEMSSDRALLLSLSSEAPCWRWFMDAYEILSHDSNAVNLEWLQSQKALILFNHNMDEYLARIDRAFIENRILYCEAYFKDSPQFEDIKMGLLSATSVAYEIQEAELTKYGQEEPDEITVTKWKPLEGSIVTIPQDESVGVIPNNNSSQNMPNSEQEEEEERLRKTNINYMAQKCNVPEFKRQEWLNNPNISLDQISMEARSMNHRNHQPQQQPAAMPPEALNGGYGNQSQRWKSLELGLSERDRANYSLARLLAYKAGFDVPKPELELEASRALGDKLNKDARGLWVPIADLSWANKRSAQFQRDAAWTGGSAGDLVQTNLGEFVSLLRSKIILAQMGATVLSGLTGNLDLPKMSQATTVQWIDEGEVIPETDTSFETVEIRPNTLASRLPVTRRLLLQASQNYDLELILRQDLVTSIAVEADRAAINGSGTGNEPLGLINNSNVTTLSLGSDGGQITYDNVVDLESAIASNNADIGSLGYVMSPSVRGAMKKTAVEPGTDRFIFEPLPQPDPNMPGAGYVNGYIAQASTTVPSDLTKGNSTGLSALIFGNWSDLYFGEFGAIDVTANPYGRMFPSGGVELRAMMDMDIKPRRTESFAVISDIIV